ncbi:MAG: phosphoribosyl-ATP diphosphatase [Woeseiaceae bacterium]|nr:phosphoribosyl-ATP diphosphatase [Woeseiaceae bacterium]
MKNKDITFISELEDIIHERLNNPDNKSYTVQLAKAGTKRIAQKLGEEGIELALSAAAGSQNEVVDEAADLMYHLLVLLADQHLTLSDVSIRLKNRHLKQG